MAEEDCTRRSDYRYRGSLSGIGQRVGRALPRARGRIVPEIVEICIVLIRCHVHLIALL